MRNYGFDYLIKKTQLLSEMAPKSKYWSSNFPKFEQLMSSVQSKMKAHEKAPDQSLIPFRKMEYVAKSLFNFLSKEELATIGINKNKDFKFNVRNLAYRDPTPDERIGNRKSKMQTSGYAKFAPKNFNNTKLEQEFMLIKMVEAYPEKAESEQFIKKLLSDKNIDAYLPDNASKSGTSKFAFGMNAKKEKMFKMTIEEVYQIQNKAKSIIKKLKISKKLPKGLATSIYHANSESVGEMGIAMKQDDTAPLQAFIDALDGILDLRNNALKIVNIVALRTSQNKPVAYEDKVEYEKLSPFEKNVLAKFKMAEIIKIKRLFQQRLDDNKPVSIAKIKDTIDQLGNETISEFVRDEFDGHLSDYNTQVYSVDAERYATVYDSLTDDLLDDLVAENIIDEEESQILAKWRNISSSLKQSIVSKSSKNEEKAAEAQSRKDVSDIRQGEYEKRGKRWEAENKMKEKGIKKPNIDITDDVEGLSKAELVYKLEYLMDTDDPDLEKINALKKYINKMSDEDEEGVMGYMTEQITKDSHINIIGEYKDRGFKKSKNYARWVC